MRNRTERILIAAVSGGYVNPLRAFPEFFGDDEGTPGAFPSTDADMTGFRLEDATAASYEADMEALIRASERISLREQPQPEPPRFAELPADPMWP